MKGWVGLAVGRADLGGKIDVVLRVAVNAEKLVGIGPAAAILPGGVESPARVGAKVEIEIKGVTLVVGSGDLVVKGESFAAGADRFYVVAKARQCVAKPPGEPTTAVALEIELDAARAGAAQIEVDAVVL